MYLKLLGKNDKEILKYYNTPFYVYLSLSNMCNANCVFCDVRKNEIKKNSIDVKILIDELSSLGTKYVHFTGGGEPFINDEIFEYMEYCTLKNINIIFTSNGFNLNEEKIKKLANYNIIAIFFSIDSHDPKIHDSLRRVQGIWKQVTNNINLIKKYLPKTKIVINHVLNKNNIDFFENFIKLKEKYDFDYVNPIVIKDFEELFFEEKQILNYNLKINYYHELAKTFRIDFLYDDIEIFNKDVSKYGDRENNLDLKCIYPSFCAFIDAPTGYVYPCDCSVHRDRKTYKIGDLKEESFYQVWKGEPRKKLKEQLIKSKLNCKTKCDQANCEFNKCYFECKKRG